MIGAYIVEQYLRCHWPRGAACGCFVVGCSALVFYGSTIFSKPMDFPCTADCYLWRILENFLGGCLPFHLPHTQAQTLIFTFRYSGDWDPIVCPWPRPHLLFVSQESCSLFSAVTAERWGTHSYLPLCYHQQLISTARMSEPPSDPAMLTATASTGGLLVSTKLLFASLCFSFSPSFPSSVTSWLLLRKWAPSFCPVSR